MEFFFPHLDALPVERALAVPQRQPRAKGAESCMIWNQIWIYIYIYIWNK